MRGKSVLKVSAQAPEVRSPNGCCWLPSKLGGEAYLGGRLALLGFDGYCVFTHSIHGVEPGKYWPDGELFFFLIQKEPAIAPNSETFSPFINPGIRLPCFSADVVEKCALFASHFTAEEGKRR